MKLIWDDAGYSGQLIDWVKMTCDWVLEIVKRSHDVKEFKVLPHRWGVERTGEVIIICKEMGGNFQSTNKKCSLLSQEL